MNKVLVILGSTSTGKTDLALRLAKKFNGELIACDSRQVYKGLDIGTGKMPSSNGQFKKRQGYWEIDGVKIWMYDVAEPNKQYTAYDFVKDGRRAIKEITTENKLPIIVGGTGLYLRAFIDGLPNLGIPVDQKLRKSLEKLSLLKLQYKLQELSFEKWQEMNNSDRQNPRRLIRHIEMLSNNSRQFKKTKADGISGWSDLLKIGLIGPRQILYEKSNQRVVKRISQGMIIEAKRLYKEGLSLERMRQLGLEYRILFCFSVMLTKRNKIP